MWRQTKWTVKNKANVAILRKKNVITWNHKSLFWLFRKIKNTSLLKFSSLAPIDGHWGRWSSWGLCDAKCGLGTHHRSRSCDDPPPRYGGKNCVGNSSSSQSCKLKSCGIGKWRYFLLFTPASVYNLDFPRMWSLTQRTARSWWEVWN